MLLPNYNGAAYLEQAVTSALWQTYASFEVLAIDDGSTDASPAILEDLAREHGDRLRVLEHPGHANRGLIETYALGLREARGTIVAFLESDDLWEPDNLELKVRALREHPEAGVVHASYRAFGELRGAAYWSLYGVATRLTTPAGRPYEALGSLLFRNPIPSFTHFAVRRELLEGLPPVRGMKRCCDWWTLAHLSLRAPFCYIPRRLTRWRIHRTSSHYGPVRMPLRELGSYLEEMYASLEASPEIARRPGFRGAIEWARRFLSRLDLGMLDGGRQWMASLRRHPATSFAVLADTALRYALFS